MDELEAIRAKKLRQLQESRQQQAYDQESQRQEQLREAMAQIDSLVSRFLTTDAQDRLSNLKLVDPELVQKLKIYLAQLYASGRIKQMDDKQLREILVKLKSSKKDITIKRQ